MKKGSQKAEDLVLEGKLNCFLPTRLASNGPLLVISILFVVGFLSVVLQRKCIQTHVPESGASKLVFGNIQDDSFPATQVTESITTVPLIQREPDHKSATDRLAPQINETLPLILRTSNNNLSTATAHTDETHPSTQVNEGMSQLVRKVDDSTPNVSTNFTEIVQRHQLATVFKTHFSLSNNNSFPWCTKENKKPTGLLNNKIPKAASSTMAGVALRIAHKFSERPQAMS